MSLQTDIVFIKAIESSEQIEELVEGHIYNTFIPDGDEDDNTPIPYIIVTFDGLNNDGITKDSEYEGCTDRVQIGVEVAAKNRESLAQLTTLIRKTVRDYFINYQPSIDVDLTNLIPLDYAVSAQGVMYDPWKPCHWQVLTYQCETNTDLYEQE